MGRDYCGRLCVQASLNKLMETLGQSEPYFVKCIRSNAEKVGPCVTLPSSEVWCVLLGSRVTAPNSAPLVGI